MGRDIRKYEVFLLSHQLVLKVYEITRKFPAEERYGLSLQMRRAAYSIPMNLIEGGARLGEKEFRQFVNIARGSCAELVYQLQLAKDLRYLQGGLYENLKTGYEQVGKMLNGLFKKLQAISQ